MSNKNKSSLVVSTLALTIVSLLGFNALTAAEIEAELRAGYSVSDNIYRDENVEIEEDLVTGGFSFDLTEHTRRLTAAIRSKFDYLNYKDDTFEEEWVGGVEALVKITVVDERLIWTFQDNYGQRLSDPLGTPNPGNRENVNFFTTGPNLRAPFASRGFFGAEGRYSLITYEDTPTDNNRLAGLVQIGRRMNADADISLNVAAERVEFEDTELWDPYDIREAFIRYEKFGQRDTVSIDVGYTDVETAANEADGYLLRLDWKRTISQAATFQFGGGSKYSSEGDIFRLAQGNARKIGNTEDISGDATPYRSHYVYSRYSLNGERTRISFAVEWTIDDYAFVSALDRDVVTGEFFIERDVSKSIFANINIEIGNREYSFIEQNYDDLIVKAALGYRYSSALNVQLGYLHYKRDSDIEFGSFTESRVVFGITYVPTWGDRQRKR